MERSAAALWEAYPFDKQVGGAEDVAWARTMQQHGYLIAYQSTAVVYHRHVLDAQFQRLARRRGPKKASVAVAHGLLVVIYHVLRNGKSYEELGVDYFNKIDTTRMQRHHVRRLEQLGYKVSLTPAA